jgi:hypothetical protein
LAEIIGGPPDAEAAGRDEKNALSTFAADVFSINSTQWVG